MWAAWCEPECGQQDVHKAARTHNVRRACQWQTTQSASKNKQKARCHFLACTGEDGGGHDQSVLLAADNHALDESTPMYANHTPTPTLVRVPCEFRFLPKSQLTYLLGCCLVITAMPTVAKSVKVLGTVEANGGQPVLDLLSSTIGDFANRAS